MGCVRVQPEQPFSITGIGFGDVAKGARVLMRGLWLRSELFGSLGRNRSRSENRLAISGFVGVVCTCCCTFRQIRVLRQGVKNVAVNQAPAHWERMLSTVSRTISCRKLRSLPTVISKPERSASSIAAVPAPHAADRRSSGTT